MQQIYLGWDIMDEYHNIIDHYQGYYFFTAFFKILPKSKHSKEKIPAVLNFQILLKVMIKREDWIGEPQ